MMKNDKEKEINEKKMKKLEENCNFSFFGKLQVSSGFFYVFHCFFPFWYNFSSFVYDVSSIPPLEAKKVI